VSRRISRHPVSAVCLESGFIAHGDVEGLVGFVRVKDLRRFGGAVKIHELPVTALVIAISYTTRSTPPCALSVSADYKLAATPLLPLAIRRVTMSMSVLVVILWLCSMFVVVNNPLDPLSI